MLELTIASDNQVIQFLPGTLGELITRMTDTPDSQSVKEAQFYLQLSRLADCPVCPDDQDLPPMDVVAITAYRNGIHVSPADFNKIRLAFNKSGIIKLDDSVSKTPAVINHAQLNPTGKAHARASDGGVS